MAWQGILGLVGFTVLAWIFSEDRRALRLQWIAVGIGLQLLVALIMLRLPGMQKVFLKLNDGILGLQAATREGTAFVFGYLGGAEAPFAASDSGSSFVLAFQALPLVLVISALSSLLFYWRVLPWLVGGFSWLLRRSLGVGGALGLGAAANVFVGMVESPLLIRPYLARMSRAELFAVMTCGMATVAGTVMVLYASILAPVLPNAVGHILTASLISAPAAIMIAWVMVPQVGAGTEGRLHVEGGPVSAMDAVVRGTVDGLRLLGYILAMLVVFVSLVALVNQMLGFLPDIAGEALSLQRVLGWLLAPLAWLMGIPWSEAVQSGALLGTKVVLNEMLAYLEMAALPADSLSERSRLILAYGLCGFANLGSLGIMLGGMTAMVPERRSELVALGPKSILSGVLATCMTGAVVGLVR